MAETLTIEIKDSGGGGGPARAPVGGQPIYDVLPAGGGKPGSLFGQFPQLKTALDSLGALGVPGAGALSGLAGAAGPAAIAVASAVAFKVALDTARQAALRNIDIIGTFAQGVGRLDVGALADGFLKIAGQLPIVGQLLEAAGRQLRGFVQAVDSTAERLAPFSGPLAGAQAQAQVAQILGDLRRAQLLGPDLAEFVQARARLSQTGQDALAQLLRPLIPGLTRLVNAGAGGLEVLGLVAERLGQVLNDMQPALAILNQINPLYQLVVSLEKIIRKAQAEKDLANIAALDDLLALNAEGLLHDIIAQDRRREAERAEALRGFRLNIPALGGGI